MTRKHAVSILVAIVACVTGVFAQQRPNFSGRWVLVSPVNEAGQQQVVKHDATTLSTEHPSEGGSHGSVYKLDGTQSRNVLTSHGEDIVTLSNATWKGNALTITSATTYPDGRKLDSIQVWSIDAEGQLIVDFTETMTGRQTTKMRLVYKKR